MKNTSENITKDKPIEKVFAFPAGSIDTSYMAGENLKPLDEGFNPTVLNVLKREFNDFIKKAFGDSTIKGYECQAERMNKLKFMSKREYETMNHEDRATLGPVKTIRK